MKLKAIVNVNLEFDIEADTKEEALAILHEVELPGCYVEDSFELVKFLDEDMQEPQEINGIFFKENL